MSLLSSLKTTVVCLALAASSVTFAAEPSGYYSSCENKGGAELLKALCAKVGPHTTVSYDGLFTVYATSDVRPNGKIWDMYSTKEWNLSGPRCGNYKVVGDCYNREHSFPKSWFNDAKPMYSDAYHLYPTDGKVNGQRSNFPYGECAGGTTLPANGSVKALGRLGTSTFPGYSGKVFEPVDEYKGDFARSYFYMAAAYNNKIGSWHSDMLAGNSYPAFSGWAVNLLLKWHRQDPVSQKEIDRNEAVSKHQKNRNPFIDHPEMAEYIWGDKKNSLWSLNGTADPEFILPVAGSTVDFGAVAVGKARNTTITVRARGLTDDVTLSFSNSTFSSPVATLSASQVCTTSGATLPLSCNAISAGKTTGRLTLRSGNQSTYVNLTATAYDGLPASAPTDITDVSFVAHWTYVGDEDAQGNYLLSVFDASGEAVDTYPRAVNARAEAYLVDELMPETAYTYRISNGALTSNTISVATSAPIPSIQMLYDGDLYLETEPGTPSEAAEILLDVENIDTDITLSVTAPFELSSDKANWAGKLVVNPMEDRFYLRVNSAVEGVFDTSIKATAGDYMTDDAEVQAKVSTIPSFIEDFETSAPGGYNNPTFKGTAADWLLHDAGVYSGEAYEGSNSLRFGKSAASSITLDGVRNNGIGTLRFHSATWAGDGEANIAIQTSADNGVSWETVTTVTIPKSDVTLNKSAYKEYTVTINRTGRRSLRLLQTSGKRVGFDNISLTDHKLGLEGVESDYRSWDAFCRGGLLIVELAEASQVAVYGVDGRTYHLGNLPAGESSLEVPAGLYIVSVADFSRRVLVK